MKKLFLFSALLVLSLAPWARAQYRYTIVRAEIPFSFSLAGQSFPAGEYSWVTAGPNLLALRDQAGRVLTSILVHSVERDITLDTPSVRFYAEGDRYDLVEVWQANNHIGYQLPRPKRATMLARRAAVKTIVGTLP